MSKPYAAQLRSQLWESEVVEIDPVTYDATIVIETNKNKIVNSDYFKHYAAAIEFYTDSAGTVLGTPEFGFVEYEVKTTVRPEVWQKISFRKSSVDCVVQVDWAAVTNSVRVLLTQFTLEAPYVRMRVVGMAS